MHISLSPSSSSQSTHVKCYPREEAKSMEAEKAGNCFCELKPAEEERQHLQISFYIVTTGKVFRDFPDVLLFMKKSITTSQYRFQVVEGWNNRRKFFFWGKVCELC